MCETTTNKLADGSNSHITPVIPNNINDRRRKIAVQKQTIKHYLELKRQQKEEQLQKQFIKKLIILSIIIAIIFIGLILMPSLFVYIYLY